jgi:hypothetical protein
VSRDFDFELDEHGDVIVNPLIGWKTATVANSAVVLEVQYADCPVGLENGRNSLQLVLTPLQSLELAEGLTREVRRILADMFSTQKPN